jgi:ribosome-binding ATPase YchF (GTP1/OBG family)
LHVDGEVEPYKDIEVINLELTLADSEQVRLRRDKIERDIRAGQKEAIAEDAALTKLAQAFAAGKLAIHAGLSADELLLVKHLNLLTLKPILYGLNRKSGGHNLDELNDGRATRCYELIKELGGRYVMVDAATERELMMWQMTTARDCVRSLVCKRMGSLTLFEVPMTRLVSFLSSRRAQKRHAHGLLSEGALRPQQAQPFITISKINLFVLR